MRERELRPATRADWFDLVKVAALMDLALILGLVVCMTAGGHS